MTEYKINPFDKFNHDWALVTAGNKDYFNSMTISWGSMGRYGIKVLLLYIFDLIVIHFHF